MRLYSMLCLFLLYFGASAILPDTLDDYNMYVTFGKPLETSGGLVFAISWTDCLRKCLEDPTCVLIYDTTPTCHYYYVENLITVQKLNSSSDSRIAFRILSRNKICPIEENSPILIEGNTVQTDVQRDYTKYGLNQYLPINITLKNDVWTFAQRSQPFSCFPGMELMRRGGSIWCMMVGASGSCITRARANEICMASFQQPLAGPGTPAEYEFIRSSAMSFLDNPPAGTVPANYTQLGFWLDGVRNKNCYYPAKAGYECSGNSEFVFSDPTAPNPALEWLEGQPDGLSKRTNGDCVYYIARSSDPAGTDDLQCTTPQYGALNLCMVGYYCGSNIGADTWN